MKFANKHEEDIYRSGFFAGKNSVKKSNYTQEEIQDLKCYLNTFLNASISDFAEAVDQIYSYPEWYKKIPFLKEKILAKEEFLKEWEKARNFLCYVQDKALPEYLEYLNKRKDKSL